MEKVCRVGWVVLDAAGCRLDTSRSYSGGSVEVRGANGGKVVETEGFHTEKSLKER